MCDEGFSCGGVSGGNYGRSSEMVKVGEEGMYVYWSTT